MSRVFIQYLIERVYSFFISFMFNQVKASLKGFIVNDNNSSDSLFCNKSCSSFECYLIIIIIIIIIICYFPLSVFQKNLYQSTIPRIHFDKRY
jgi:hypothetical protein